MEEVFVFGDEDHLTLRGNAPDFGVGSFREPRLEDVFTLVVPVSEETDEGEGELIIDQELHET